jgi:hypothetical protein
MKKKKITMYESDFDYLLRFEKYIRHFKPEIYKDATNWAIDENNLPGYPDKTLEK